MVKEEVLCFVNLVEERFPMAPCVRVSSRHSPSRVSPRINRLLRSISSSPISSSPDG